MSHIAVIDYGMGNLRSVSKALETVSNGVPVEVTADPVRIFSASHVIFPGVGAMRDCIAELSRLQLDDVLRDVIKSGKPVLGICLGMQALLRHSEENNGTEGLNVISGEVQHFDIKPADNGEHLKVPHMGWNEVEHTSSHPVWNGIEQNSRFYFVHSYFVSPDDHSVIAATTHYPNRFCSAIVKNNLFAVQFHPEKSQHVGLKLLENFLNWDGKS